MAIFNALSRLSGFSDGSRAVRPRTLWKRRALRVQTLESRRVLTAVVMTPYEQLLLELINRARSDPGAEAARFGIGLNEGISDTIVNSPKQPVAPNQILVNAAGAHSQDMIDNDYFSHTGLGGQSPSDRAIAAGYPLGVWENIAYGGSTGPIDPEANVYERHRRLFLSTTGHRQNILLDSHQEVGTGVRFGPFTSGQFTYNVGMVTEKFGNPPGNSFLTGVAFTDASDGSAEDDDFYNIGEQISGGTITATNVISGDTFSTTVGPSGGYSLQLSPGTYTVTASGGGFAADYIVDNVAIAAENVKVDFETTTSTEIPSTAPTPELSVQIASEVISESNGSTTGTVSRSGDTSSSLVVSLASDDTNEATVPATIVIAAGATTASFAITAVDDDLVDGTQTVAITANATGYESDNATISVSDDDAPAEPSPDPVSHQFDFGTASSPLQPGYTRVTGATTYNATLGHGWTASVNQLDRRVGTSLTRDLHYVNVGTFVVDVPNGTYEVSLTLGDSGAAHDQTIYLEGASVDSVTTGAGQFVTRTYTTDVNDGQLTVMLDGRGGVDPNMVISGLTVTGTSSQQPDEPEPTPELTIATSDSVIAENGGSATATVTRSGSTSAPLIVSLSSSDTGEATVPDTVTIAAGQTSAIYTISGVDDDIVDGTQLVTVAAAAIGYDGHSIVVSVTDDDVQPEEPDPTTDTAPRQFDFGTTSSPLEPGYTRVTGSTTYNAERGYGWTSNVNHLDRRAGTSLTRDLHYRDLGTFLIDVPNGTYEVAVTIGDSGAAHDQTIFLEGVSVDSVTNAAGRFVTRTYTAVVADNQLTVQLDGRGGVDPNFVINSLQVTAIDVPQPDEPEPTPELTLTVAESSISENGGNATATISRGGDTTELLVVNLSSSDNSEATVPVTIAIAAGQASASFSVSGVDDNVVDGTQAVTITAAAIGYEGDNETIDVSDDDVLPEDPDPPAQDPVSWQFDFGTPSSPLESGHTRVTASSTYNATLGYGWTSNVSHLDRGNGTSLTRDLHYRDTGTFVVDVPNGTYEVAFTVGDSGAAHDQTFYLEGEVVGSVTTAARRFVTRTYTTSVNDGQLTITLDGRGGVDPNMVISGLQVTATGNTQPNDPEPNPELTLAITNSAISENGGTTNATVSRSGDTTENLIVTLTSDDTGEAIVPATVTIAAGQSTASFTVSGVDDAIVDGTQLVSVGVSAEGYDGDSQSLSVTDDDTAPEEPTVDPVSLQFDFGTTSSPLQAGHTRVTGSTTYSDALGYGWAERVSHLDRRIGSSLTRDLHYRNVGTFLVDVPNGTYEVTLTVGDSGAAHDQTLRLEGISVDTLVNAAGQFITRTYVTSVSDGQLTLELDGRGGVDPNMVISGLQVTGTGNQQPTEPEPTPELTLSFSAHSISEQTGTTATVSRSGSTSEALVVTLSSSDTSEAVVPTTITIDAGQASESFLILGVDDNTVDGNQVVTIGAAADGFENVSDTLGVDDDDDVPEEPATEPFSQQFDFGTASSPLQSDHTRVTGTTTYNATLGHGWTSNVNHLDRRVGDSLTRDLHYRDVGTFVIDVPNGTYEATLVVGDSGAAHDQTIHLEGVAVDSVFTAAGQFVARTYIVAVNDGQLTIQLDGRGGVDPNMVISGLRVDEVTGEQAATSSFSPENVDDFFASLTD